MTKATGNQSGWVGSKLADHRVGKPPFKYFPSVDGDVSAKRDRMFAWLHEQFDVVISGLGDPKASMSRTNFAYRYAVWRPKPQMQVIETIVSACPD